MPVDLMGFKDFRCARIILSGIETTLGYLSPRCLRGKTDSERTYLIVRNNLITTRVIRDVAIFFTVAQRIFHLSLPEIFPGHATPSQNEPRKAATRGFRGFLFCQTFPHHTLQSQPTVQGGRTTSMRASGKTHWPPTLRQSLVSSPCATSIRR